MRAKAVAVIVLLAGAGILAAGPGRALFSGTHDGFAEGVDASTIQGGEFLSRSEPLSGAIDPKTLASGPTSDSSASSPENIIELGTSTSSVQIPASLSAESSSSPEGTAPSPQESVVIDPTDGPPPIAAERSAVSDSGSNGNPVATQDEKPVVEVETSATPTAPATDAATGSTAPASQPPPTTAPEGTAANAAVAGTVDPSADSSAATSASGPASFGTHSTHVKAGANRKSALEVPLEHELTSFEKLATFWYEPPDPDKDGPRKSNNDQIPENVRALDGKKIVIEGYMIPISVDKGKVTSFILSRYFASCCFGQMPEMNEWIEVEVEGDSGIDYLPYGAVVCQGAFSVGEVLDDYGYVRSLFRMKATTVKESF